MMPQVTNFKLLKIIRDVSYVHGVCLSLTRDGKIKTLMNWSNFSWCNKKSLMSLAMIQNFHLVLQFFSVC